MGKQILRNDHVNLQANIARKFCIDAQQKLQAMNFQRIITAQSDLDHSHKKNKH